MSCYFFGDYNINLLSSEGNLFNNEFIDMFCSFSFYPVIDKPTRITKDSATLIDNMFTNKPDTVRESGILFGDISDHLTIFSVISPSCIFFNSDNVNSFKRVVNDYNIAIFCRHLRVLTGIFV